MRLATPAILIIALLAQFASGAAAQQAPAAEDTSSTAAAATTSSAPTEPAGPQASDEARASQAEVEASNDEVRREFSTILRNHPNELSSVLAIDPSLLSNRAYLAAYPDVAEFVADHPEILRNPAFYMAEFERPESGGAIEKIIEPLTIMGTIGIFVFGLAWFVRAVIEQKRWTRLSRTQTDVHTKILDRFGSSEEVLAYMRTPAGTKFLESAPIPVRTEQPIQSAPMARILWSLQLGVVLAVGALGMVLVSFRFEKETAQDLFALGAIGFCIGAGFIASAAVSLALTRRLGLLQGAGSPPTGALDDSGLVR